MKLLPYLILALCLAHLTSCNPVKSTAAADQGVTDFHTLYDAEDFEGIYKTSHEDFKGAQPKEQVMSFLQNMRELTGPVQSTKRNGWEAKTYNFETEVIVTYITEFENGPGTESFSFRIKDDAAYLRGWYIESPLLTAAAEEAAAKKRAAEQAAPDQGSEAPSPESPADADANAEDQGAAPDQSADAPAPKDKSVTITPRPDVQGKITPPESETE